MGDLGSIPGLGRPPGEKEMAIHSSILAWRIPWTVYSMGSQRVGHNWVTFTKMCNFQVGLRFLNFSKMTLATVFYLFCSFKMHWRRVWGFWASQVAPVVKNPPTMQETKKMQIPYLGWEVRLEEGTTPHSSILAWRISWTEEPGGLQSLGLPRVRRLERLSMHAREVLCWLKEGYCVF